MRFTWCRRLCGLVDLVSGQRLECPEPDWQFDRFGSMDGIWYLERPPFDCVLVFPETHVVFARSELRFVLASLVEKE